MGNVKNMVNKNDILIVEDSATQALKVQMFLEDNNYRVFVAHSGKDAIALLKSCKPSIVISDIIMPGMSGYELCSLMKEDELFKDIPVILLTGLSNSDDILHGLAAGADDYILKPYENEDLLKKINFFLGDGKNKYRTIDTNQLEVAFEDRRYLIKSKPEQILHLLLSTYENIVNQNAQLVDAHSGLERLNQELADRLVELGVSREKLQKSEEKFRVLVHMIPDIVYRIDKNGLFTFINNAVSQLGYTPCELIGKHFSTIMNAEDVKNVSRSERMKTYRGSETGSERQPKLFDERRTGDRTTKELEINLIAKEKNVRFSGILANIENNNIVVEVNSSGMYETDETARDSKFVGTVGIIRDITRRKKVEAEAEKCAIDLQRSLEKSEKLCFLSEKAKGEALKYAKETEKANNIKNEFLANMSHELRTPLNGIMGLTESIMQSTITEEQRGNLNLIMFSAESLLTLVNDILDLSRIESGKLQLNIVEFALIEQVENVAQQQAFLAHKNGVEFIVSIDRNVPAFVMGDPNRLGEILVNLVGNAIKFTEKGEIVLSVNVESCEKGNVVVHFHIKDTGIGIPGNMQDSIFERFTQVDSSALRKFGGVGLGITISNELVHLMNGKIWLESEEGKGSDFHFTAQFCISEVTGEVKNLSVDDINGLRVLIADDNVLSRQIFCEQISSFGCICRTASSYKQTMELLVEAKQNGETFDLLLIDSIMGEMDGLKFVHSIRDLPEMEDLKVIVLAPLGTGSAEKSKKAGADGYLTKPVKHFGIFNTISEVAGRGCTRVEETSEDIKVDANSHSLRVLLVEDNVVNQAVAKSALTILGHSLSIAENGKEAIYKWENGDYDLILMDIQMPVMDGFEATQTIRKMEKALMESSSSEVGSCIPIIAMTACAMEGDKEKCLDAGMDDYISKPITLIQLREKLDKILVGVVRDVDILQDEVVGVEACSVKEAVYDLSNLKTLLNNDSESIQRIIKKFIESTECAISELGDAVKGKEMKTIKRIAHTIKGVAAQMGARELMEIALGIETAKMDSEQLDLSSEISELVDAYEKVKLGIADEL